MLAKISSVIYRKRDNTYHISYASSNKNRVYAGDKVLPKTVRSFIVNHANNVEVDDGLIIWK